MSLAPHSCLRGCPWTGYTTNNNRCGKLMATCTALLENPNHHELQPEHLWPTRASQHHLCATRFHRASVGIGQATPLKITHLDGSSPKTKENHLTSSHKRNCLSILVLIVLASPKNESLGFRCLCERQKYQKKQPCVFQ